MTVHRPTIDRVRSDWRLIITHAGVTGLILALVGLRGWGYAAVAALVFLTLVWSPNR